MYGLPRLEETNEGYILPGGHYFPLPILCLADGKKVIDTQLDIHLRVRGKKQYSQYLQITHIALVINEYARFAETLLIKSGYRGQRKLHQYQAFATHSIDQPHQWPDWH
ncbi:MAG: hypothetical protein IPF93_16790 [Saprospiraceae bacterium]|nr:hypothetical protein [Saprospiraceae bacterium]